MRYYSVVGLHDHFVGDVLVADEAEEFSPEIADTKLQPGVGYEVQQLRERLTAIHRDGHLSGADAIEVLDQWFHELGMPLPQPGEYEPDDLDDATEADDAWVMVDWQEVCRYRSRLRLSELNAALAESGDQPVTRNDLDALHGEVGGELDLVLADRVGEDFEGAYERAITDTQAL